MKTKKCIRCGREKKVTEKGKYVGLCESCIHGEQQKQRKKMEYMSKKNQFNNISKNYVRNKLIEIINLRKTKKILTLESSEFLFAKQIPNKKVFVFEDAPLEFKKMQKTKPKNVRLFQGNISQCSELDNIFDFIWLDFCFSFDNAIQVISELKNKIAESELFAVTFCLRYYFAEECDYQFEIIRKLQDILEIPLKVLYGYSYRTDRQHGTMITILFENLKELKGGNK